MGNTLIEVTQLPAGTVVSSLLTHWPPHPGSHCLPMWFLFISPTQLLSTRLPLPIQLSCINHYKDSLTSSAPSAQPPSRLSKVKFANDSSEAHSLGHTHTHFFLFLPWLPNEHLILENSLPSFLVTPTQPLELSPPPGSHPWLFLLGRLRPQDVPVHT